MAGTFFMTAPGAKVESISKFVGFRTPTSFWHALRDAGLPPAQELQRRARAA
jgi:hypothetical protein